MSCMPDNKVFMSDSLNDLVDDTSFLPESEEKKFVHVILNDDSHNSDKVLPVVGLLQTVLFSDMPEIEFKVALDVGLETLCKHAKTTDPVFRQPVKIEIHHGENVMKLSGSYKARAVRLQDVDTSSQMCVLAMQLEAA